MLRKRRKITGCILSILLTVALITGCAGEKEDGAQSRDDRDNTESRSGRDDALLSGSSDSEENSGEDDTEPSISPDSEMDSGAGKIEPGAEKTASNIGIIKDNAYANLLMGFGCIIEDGWTFSTREEIAEVCGITIDVLDQADLSSAIDAGMYDMMASSADGLVNMNVVIQDVGVMGSMVQEKDVVKQAMGQVEQIFGSMGFSDLESQAQSIDFVDGEHAGIYNTATIETIPFYQSQVVYKVGTHIAYITVSSYVEDFTKDVLSWFDTAEAVMPDPDI